MRCTGWILFFIIVGLMSIQITSADESVIARKFETNYRDGSVAISGDGNTIVYDEFRGGKYNEDFKYTIVAMDKYGRKKWTYEASSKYYDTTNLMAIYSKNIDTSFDGNYTVFGFNSELYALDGAGKLRWKYKPNNVLNNNDYLNFNRVSISSNGEYIAAMFYSHPDGIDPFGGTIYFLNNIGQVIWSQHIENESLQHISISPNGDYVSVSTITSAIPGQTVKSISYLFNKNGQKIKTFDDKDFYGSEIIQKITHEGIVLKSYTKIAYFDHEFNEKWRISKLFLFSWDEIPGKDNSRLIEFLVQNYGAKWVKTAKIEKIDNNKAIKIFTENHNVLLRLHEETITFDDGSIYEFDEYEENGKFNIYYTLRSTGNLASSISGDVIVTQTEAEGGSEGKLAIINNGVVSEQLEINDAIRYISMSAGGDYIAARSNDVIYLIKKSSSTSTVNQINSKGDETTTINLVSPRDGEALDNPMPAFDWSDVKGASKYLIKIDEETFETATSEFTLVKNLSLGKHEWMVKSISSNSESSWTQPRSFSIVSSEGKTILKTVQALVVDRRVLAGGMILFILLLGIIVRPFYKRWAVKKKLEKTATDWCPHCHKFTGGAETCPHCGLSTLTSSEYTKEKQIKSKK